MEKVEYIYVDDNKEAQRAVDHLLTFDRLGYDTETTGLDIVGNKAKLLLMQLGTDEIAYLFDPRKIDALILKEILESKKILKILHNAKFDYQTTVHDTGIRLTNIFDTMLAYRLLTSGLIESRDGSGFVATGFRDKNKKVFPYKSLSFVCERLLGITLDKSVRKTFVDHQYNKEYTPTQLEYAAKDIVVLPALCDILSQQLLEEDLIDTALLEFEFVQPAAEMELNGVRINKEKWREIIAQARRLADGFAADMSTILEPLSDQHTLFGESVVNIKSQDQLMVAFQKLGFDLESTNEKVIKKIDHPLASLLVEYRAYEKLISTYGEAILRKISPVTERLHYTLHQLGADTGRLSSEKPNIQNIPNDRDGTSENGAISFRDCFEAAPGNKLLTADYSQCELRILAEVSQDRKFLEIFKSGEDLHIITAQQVFGISDKELAAYQKIKSKDGPDIDLLELFSSSEVDIYKKIGDLRDKTKTINFGIVYGMNAWSLAERFKISQSAAEDILNDYFKTYVGIKRWLGKNAHDALVNRQAKTILGRKKYFHLPDPEDEEQFRRSSGAVRRQGNNHVIQGTNADITKEALVRLQQAYNELDGVMALFTVHDEIVSEVPANMAEQVAEIKAEIMKKAFHRFIKTVPVGKGDKVSVTIATRWSK